MEQALLRFAQTADREFAVENGEAQLIGTLALLDLVLARKRPLEPSARELPFAKLNRSECSKDRDDVVRRPN